MPKKRPPAETSDDGLLALTSSAPRRGPKALREARVFYREVYQLRVELKDLQPSIWRRLIVPAGFTLHELHLLLQDALGWMDYHLYEFSTKHATFAEPDPDDDEHESFREWVGPHFDPERFSAELVNRGLLRAQGVWRKRMAKLPASG